MSSTAGIRLAEDVGGVLRAQARVDRHEHGADLHHREHRLDELGPVHHPERDLVAGCARRGAMSPRASRSTPADSSAKLQRRRLEVERFARAPACRAARSGREPTVCFGNQSPMGVSERRGSALRDAHAMGDGETLTHGHGLCFTDRREGASPGPTAKCAVVRCSHAGLARPWHLRCCGQRGAARVSARKGGRTPHGYVSRCRARLGRQCPRGGSRVAPRGGREAAEGAAVAEAVRRQRLAGTAASGGHGNGHGGGRWKRSRRRRRRRLTPWHHDRRRPRHGA